LKKFPGRYKSVDRGLVEVLPKKESKEGGNTRPERFEDFPASRKGARKSGRVDPRKQARPKWKNLKKRRDT